MADANEGQGRAAPGEVKVKGKASAARYRDRAYWETQTSRSLVKVETRVQEIDLDDGIPLLPPGPRKPAPFVSLLEHRRFRWLVSAGLSASVAGVLLISPATWARPHASPTPSGTGRAAPTQPVTVAQATSAPSASPSPYAFATTARNPLIPSVRIDSTRVFIGGWPLSFDSFGGAVVGPDGTLYVPWTGAFDSAGEVRNGWMPLPDGTHPTPMAFGSDGTAYVLAADPSGSATRLWAFDSTGKPIAGWPVVVDIDATVLAGPGGSVYILSGFGAATARVSIYSHQGKRTAQWSVVAGPGCGAFVRPDGSLVLATSRDEVRLPGPPGNCTIRAYDAGGRLLTATPSTGWDAIDMGPTGLVVAWTYEYQPYSYAVAQTRVMVAAPNGEPAAVMSFEGAASRPAFGPDGSVYFSQAGLGTSPSKVVALQANGSPKPGWPISLPDSSGPLMPGGGVRPMAPVVGNGIVYVPAMDSKLGSCIMAFDEAGRVVPGWPYALGGEPVDHRDLANFGQGGVFFATGNGGRLYVELFDRIVALSPSGRTLAGWPHLLPPSDTGSSWVFLQSVSDGGLIVAEYRSDRVIFLRWAANGKPAS